MAAKAFINLIPLRRDDIKSIYIYQLVLTLTK